MKRIFITCAMLFISLGYAQKKDTVDTYDANAEYLQTLNSSEYKTWKTVYLSRIQRAKVLKKNAENIRKKYVFRNMFGESVFRVSSFSAIDQKNYRMVISNLGKVLSMIEADHNFNFSGTYLASLPFDDTEKSSELLAIYQFYKDAL